MDKSSKQNINKDIVALNKALDEMDLTDIYRVYIRKKQNTHSFQMHMEHFHDRPHDRTQNKSQQVQENRNHIKHFLRPQGTETRNKSQEKKPKHLNS